MSYNFIEYNIRDLEPEVQEQTALVPNHVTMSDKAFKQMEATISQQQHQLSKHQSKEAALQEEVVSLQQKVAEEQAQAKQYCSTIATLHQDREKEKQAAQAQHEDVLKYKTRTDCEISQLSQLVAWNKFTRKAIEDKSIELRNENMVLQREMESLRQKAATSIAAAYRHKQESHEINKRYIAKHVALVNEHEALKGNSVLQAAETKKLHDRIAREIDQSTEVVQEKQALERSMDKTEQRHAKEIEFLQDGAKALHCERDHSNKCIKHMGESSHKAIVVMEGEMRSVKASHKTEIDRLEKALEDERAKYIHLDAAVSSLKTENQLLKQDFASLKQESVAVNSKSNDDSDSEASTGLWAKQPNLTDRGSADRAHGPPFTKERLQEQDRPLQNGTCPTSNSTEATPTQSTSPKAMLQKIASLEAQVRAYIVTNVLLNSSLKDLTKDHQALTDYNKGLKMKNKAFGEEHEALAKDKMSLIEKNKALKADDKKWREDYEALIKDNKSLTSSNETLTSENAAVNKDHNALFLDNIAQNRKINEQAHLLSSALRQNEKHELDRKEHSKYCHLVQQQRTLSELNQTRSEMKDVRYECSVLKTQHQALTAEHKLSTDQHNALNMEYEALKTAHEPLKKAHDALKYDHAKALSQIAYFKEFHAVVESDHAKLSLEHQENLTHNKELQKQQYSLEWRSDETQRELDGLKTAYKNSQEKSDVLQKVHNALQTTHEVLEIEYTTLQTKQRNLQVTLEDLEAEHNAIQTDYEEMSIEYEELQTGHDELQGTHETLQTKLETLQLTHQNLQTEYSALQTSNMDLSDLYYDLMDQHHDLTARDMQLDMKYESLEGRFDELSSENRELELLNEKNEEELGRLRGELRLYREGCEEGWDIVAKEDEKVEEGRRG